MTQIAKQYIQERHPPLDRHANYLISQPATLLVQVEACMLAALQSAPTLHVTGSNSIEQAALYHLRAGGQRLRARLALDAAQAVGLLDHDSVQLAAAVELLHNASLIHDDLQDGDQLRRGHQSVWHKFGKNLAICCGDFYLSTAYATLSKLSKTATLPQLFQCMHQRVAEAVMGQAADLMMTPDQLGVDNYVAVVMAKSGALLSLPLELVFIFNGQDHFIDLANQACRDFSVGFQIIDDLRDIAADACESGRLSNGADRLNIVSVFADANRGLDRSVDAVPAAKALAIAHLQRAESALVKLPVGSGMLLEECCLNLRAQLNELI